MSNEQKFLLEQLINSVDESRREMLKKLLVGGLALAAPLTTSIALGEEEDVTTSPTKKKTTKKKAKKKTAKKKKKGKKKKGKKKKKAAKKKAANR
ncbi:MAG: hypothetical protein GTO03_02525 [Planctomycetales bacterium]|nr:hypothetical protein [Planctomycetales bacterium]